MKRSARAESQILTIERFSPPPAIIDRLQAARRPLLLTHVYPDGDGVGSQLALARGLKARGAEPAILTSHPAPDKFAFLDPAGEIRIASVEMTAGEAAMIEGADLFIILDTSEPSRLGRLEVPVFGARAKRLAIDHHVCRHQDSFDAIWSEPRSAATGILVLEVLLSLSVTITKAIAEALFVAIGTDTGWFRFANATPQALHAAAALVECGAEPEQLYAAVYESSSLGRTQLIGELLSGLESDAGGRVVYGALRREQLERYGVGYEEIDGFIDAMKGVRGAEIIVLFVELSPRRFKVSLRSKGCMEIHSIAEHFGGGGHPKAAGCRLEGSAGEIRERVLAAARALLAGHPQ